MTTPALPPERLLLPGLLMAAPLLAAVGSVGFTGSVGPWLVAALALLPPAGALWVAELYRREIGTVSAYLQTLTAAPGSATEPGADEGEGVAHELTAAIARLDRAAASRGQALATRLETTEALLDALPDPLILVGAERQVRRTNQAARTLFGERMGEGEADLALTLRHPEVMAAVDAVLGGGGGGAVEFSLSGPVERTYQARIKPFRRHGGDGRTPMVLLSLHDITTVKRSEQQRADLVANASHELRTPLATLIGFIETLRGPARDDREATDRFLGIMHEQSSRMARLIDDLLSLSRIELDEHTQPTERVDIVRCAGAAVAAFELKAAARRVRLRVVAEGTLPRVSGDADQLAQVLQNLISNAIKYTREQTEVTVTIRLNDASASTAAGVPTPVAVTAAVATPPGRRAGPAPQVISVAIADRGEGIARTHLPRLTERFYRVDPARSRALGGTGLGLAIVKHILNRHRGRLTIESEAGAGSTFTVWLPVSTG
ncbi:MAG: ATP-binding protein [Rhodospirillaceae bacterium]